MGRAKDLLIKPIDARTARRIICDLHYSHSCVRNSQINLGVFLDGRCGGALQFGPSIRSDLVCRLVHGTGPREFLELNRMALAEWLPRNGESRALAVALRMLGRRYPHLKWVVSFADACQSGDGAIYRAAGFLLTDIRPNNELRVDPKTGEVRHKMSVHHARRIHEWSSWRPLTGYQLRYVHFLQPAERKNLACDVIPYSRIDEVGARMYRGRALQA